MGLFLTAAALWFSSPLLISMAVLGALPFEVAWSIEYFSRLLTGKRLLGVTDYMFDARFPLYVRGLSLFHVALPVIWFLLLAQWGYDERALLWQTVLFAAVVLLTAGLTRPDENINWVFAPKVRNWRWMPLPAWILLCLMLVPAAVFLPLHALLKTWFPA